MPLFPCRLHLPLWVLAAEQAQKIRWGPWVPKRDKALAVESAVRCQPCREPKYFPQVGRKGLVILCSQRRDGGRPARSSPCTWQWHASMSGCKTLLSHEVMTPDPFCDPTPQDGLASSETAAVSVLLFFQGVEGWDLYQQSSLTILTINVLSSRKVLWEACSRGFWTE